MNHFEDIGLLDKLDFLIDNELVAPGVKTVLEEARDRISTTNRELDEARRKTAVAEQLRPVWELGLSEQAKTGALAQLWGLLHVPNQTMAVQRLNELIKRDGLRALGLEPEPTERPRNVSIEIIYLARNLHRAAHPEKRFEDAFHPGPIFVEQAVSLFKNFELRSHVQTGLADFQHFNPSSSPLWTQNHE